jgi:hypothetical protein
MRPKAPQNEVEALEAVIDRSKRASMCPQGQALMDAFAQAMLDVAKLQHAEAEQPSGEQNLKRQDQRIRAQRIEALELELQVANKRCDEVKLALVKHLTQHGCSEYAAKIP